MSMESFSNYENGKVPEYVLVQDVLSRALESEQVVDIVGYDFLIPHQPYTALSDRVVSKTFPMGIDHGLVEISPSKVAGNTHRLSLSKVPYENVHKLYLVGFPYGDTSDYDNAISGITSRENDEVEDFWDNVNNSDDEPMPEYPPFNYGDNIEAHDRKVERHMVEFDAWNERQSRKSERQIQEANKITNRYQRMRDRAQTEIDTVTRHNVSFFSAKTNKEEHNTAAVDFWTNITTASLYLPYNPISFDDFKDKTVLLVFLDFLTKEMGSIDKWAEYFSSSQSHFPIQPRLAIMSKIQTLGGKIE